MKVDPNPLARKLKDKSLPQPARNKAYAYTAMDSMSKMGAPDGAKESFKAPANGGATNDSLRYANIADAWHGTKMDMKAKLHAESVGAMIRNPDALAKGKRNPERLASAPKFGK